MTREPLASLLSGTVQADETFVGGAPKNRHGNQFAKGGQGKSDKTPVSTLIDDGGRRQARARVVTDVTGHTFRKAIADDVDMANTTLHTDGLASYKTIAHEFAGHEFVDHSANEYVRGDVSTNATESFFAQFKRSVDGTYHKVSRHHLGCYVTGSSPAGTPVT